VSWLLCFCLSPLTYPVEISWHGFLNGLLHLLRSQPRAYKWRSTRRPPLQWPTNRQPPRKSFESRVFQSLSSLLPPRRPISRLVFMFFTSVARFLFVLLLVSPCPAKDRPDISTEEPGPEMAYKTGDIVISKPPMEV
jgi:hypothetical protein